MKHQPMKQGQTTTPGTTCPTIRHNTSFIWFKTKHNTGTTGKMSDRVEEVNLTILEAMVKGYRECSFAFCVGDRFMVKKKRGESSPALRVMNNDWGQLGHLQRELLPVLCPLSVSFPPQRSTACYV